MQAKDQVMKTYGALNHWHSFRLKLFWEGILIGICSGLVISLFRWALHVVETNREHIYTYLKSTDWYWTAGWFALLILVAFVLDRLTKYEPLAAGSGIPQVKGAILGFIKMRWLQILWVKLVAGVIGIGAGPFSGPRRPFDPVRCRHGTGHQPALQTHPHGRALPAYQWCQCRLSRSLQRTFGWRNFCAGRTAPQFLCCRITPSHGRSYDGYGNQPTAIWRRHYF